MNCNDVEALFEQYMDDGLGFSEQSELENHISACPQCSQKFAAYLALKKGLSAIPDEPVPESFRQKWTSAVNSLPGEKQKKPAFIRYMPAIASGVAAIAIVSTLLLPGVFQNSSASLDAAQPETMIAAQEYSSEAKAAAPTQEQDQAAGGAQDASAAPGASNGLSMKQEAAASVEASAAPEAAAAAPAESAETGDSTYKMDMAALPLVVTPETLATIRAALVENYIAFSGQDGHLFITITEENLEEWTAIAKENGLEICSSPGESLDISAQS